MITSRKELAFYLKADRMMNTGRFEPSISERIKRLFLPDYIMSCLFAMRHVSFLSQATNPLHKVLYAFWLRRYKRLSLKVGFSIGPNVFGYGLVIPHYGTIVVGENNKVGNFAVLNSSTCIVGRGSHIGDALYMATGAKITNYVVLGNNVTAGANSVINKSIQRDGVLLVGAPAVIKKDSEPWFIRDGELYLNRRNQVINLKEQLGLD